MFRCSKISVVLLSFLAVWTSVALGAAVERFCGVIDTKLDFPTELPTELPIEIPIELPEDFPEELPEDLPGELPSELPTELSTELPTELPEDLPKVLPKVLPTEIPTCPELNECPLNCMFGYAVNKNGCEVCECQNEPCPTFGGPCRYAKKISSDEKDCFDTETCGLVLKPGVCPDVTCQSFCPFGFVNGSSGCPICKCKQSPCKVTKEMCDDASTCVDTEVKCQNPPCEWEAKCLPDLYKCPVFECDFACKNSYELDENGCKTCHCFDGPETCNGVQCPVNQKCIHDPRRKEYYSCVCDKQTCDLVCPFGLARDINGCETCKCAADPCQFVTCLYGDKCLTVQETVCLEEPCPYKAKCDSARIIID